MLEAPKAEKLPGKRHVAPSACFRACVRKSTLDASDTSCKAWRANAPRYTIRKQRDAAGMALEAALRNGVRKRRQAVMDTLLIVEAMVASPNVVKEGVKRTEAKAAPRRTQR